MYLHLTYCSLWITRFLYLIIYTQDIPMSTINNSLKTLHCSSVCTYFPYLFSYSWIIISTLYYILYHYLYALSFATLAHIFHEYCNSLKPLPWIILLYYHIPQTLSWLRMIMTTLAVWKETLEEKKTWKGWLKEERSGY